jgi:hypothetical protein
MEIAPNCTVNPETLRLACRPKFGAGRRPICVLAVQTLRVSPAILQRCLKLL